MTVSAILIRLRDPLLMAPLRAELAEEARCTAGPDRDGTLAAVLEFETADEGAELHGWLHTLPGVCAVDVVSTLHHHPHRSPHEGTPP